MNALKHIKKYIACVLFIGLMPFAFASAEGDNIVPVNNVSNLNLLSKETDIEKNINNVKVSHNPIADQINVSFKLASQNNVTIKLMDALGNEVLNLYNSNLERGAHLLSFETEGKVSSGFYFVRVTSGVETVVKRVSIRSTST